MIVFVFSSQYPVLFIFYLWSDCVVCFFFQRQYPVPFMFLPAKWFGFFWCVFSRVSSQSLSFFYPWNDGWGGGGFQSVPSPFHFLQVKWFFFSLSRVRTQSLSFCLPVKWLFFQSRYLVPFIFNLWSGFFLLSPEPVPSPLDSDNEDVAADNYGTSRQLDKNVLNNNNNNSYGTLPL